jgi:putative endonuclease
MNQPKTYWVYILTNKRRGVLYVGVTSELMKRTWQHRNGALEGFTKTYNCKRLVWWEGFGEPHLAIAREKRLKRWRREWKIQLIEAKNPEWRDLWEDLVAVPPEAIVTPLEL